MNIEKLLRNYRENKGRINILNIERDVLLQEKKLPDSVKYIKGPTFSFTPPVQNSFNSIVESANIQMERANGRIEEIEILILEIDKKRLKLSYEIGIVENLIICLDDQERFIIENYYFLNSPVCVIQNKFREKFHLISDRHIRNIKKRAFKKMTKVEKFRSEVYKFPIQDK